MSKWIVRIGIVVGLLLAVAMGIGLSQSDPTAREPNAPSDHAPA